MKSYVKCLISLVLIFNLNLNLISQNNNAASKNFADPILMRNLGISPNPKLLKDIEPSAVWNNLDVKKAINKLNNAIIAIQDNEEVKDALKRLMI